MFGFILNNWRAASEIALLIIVAAAIGYYKLQCYTCGSKLNATISHKTKLQKQLDNCLFEQAILHDAIGVENEIDNNDTPVIAPGSYSL